MNDVQCEEGEKDMDPRSLIIENFIGSIDNQSDIPKGLIPVLRKLLETGHVKKEVLIEAVKGVVRNGS